MARGSLVAAAGLASAVWAPGVAAAAADPGSPGAGSPEPGPLSEDSPPILSAGGSARVASAGLLAPAEPSYRATSVQSRLRAHFGTRFGGAFDRPDPGRYTLVVAATSTTPADLDFVASLGRPVELVPVRYPLHSLEAVHGEVDGILRDSGVTALWALNPTRNIVEVDVSSISELPAADARRLRELAALDEVVLREGFELSTVAGGYPAPRWGGVRIGVGQNVCTTGFAIDNPVFGRFMTTAGHCGPVNAPVFETNGEGPGQANVQQVDQIRARAFGGGFDHASFLMPAAEGRVWNGGSFRDVKGVQNAQWLDQNYCYRGASTGGERCAGVQTVGDFNTDGQTVTGFCLGGVTIQSGDSGGAVYRLTGGANVNAVGLLSARNPVGNYSCAANMTGVLSALSSSIVTYTPPAK
jgi:hypothetical protein